MMMMRVIMKSLSLAKENAGNIKSVYLDGPVVFPMAISCHATKNWLLHLVLLPFANKYCSFSDVVPSLF